METQTDLFCRIIRNRSEENSQAMQCLSLRQDVLSPSFSILRQELDSLVRVIYLLVESDLFERQRLIRSTLSGEKWKVKTDNGKMRNVTDREMVDLAQRLHGWTKSVYMFGCAFIHLSEFHNHHSQNPFARLTDNEQISILTYLRHYHGGPVNEKPDMEELSTYLPQVLEKIASNLECYLRQLEANEVLDE